MLPTDQEWDAFVASCAHGHHEQTSGYAAMRAASGFTSFRVVVRAEGQLVAGAQVLVRNVPLAGKLGTIQQGPLLRTPDHGLAARLGEDLLRTATQRGLRRLRVCTYALADLWAEQWQPLGFHAARHWWHADRTCRVNVESSDDALLASMSPSGRRGIRQAEKAGVEVRVVGRAHLDTFHRLLCTTAAHQGFPVFPLTYFQQLWDLFSLKGKIHLLVAYWREEPVAAIVVTASGDVAYYGWGGMSRTPEHARLHANYALHWNAMRLARNAGLCHYDLSGVSEFKTKFTDQITAYPPPVERFCGPLAGAAQHAFQYAWRTPTIRRVVRSLNHRVYGQLPY
jgi:peptidoglycan pentaglycine glycine transferase (the first glycine)